MAISLPSLHALSARVDTHEQEITRLREWRHALPSELILPIQDELVDVKLKLNTYDGYFQSLKAGIAELQRSRRQAMGRAEFFRLTVAASAGGGAVWALVTWLKP